jgi:Domain of unknown function (DUF5666)
MNRNLRAILAIVASLSLGLLTGCGTIDSVLGGGNRYPNNHPSSQGASIQGTVSYVDTQAKRIDLDAYGNGGRRNNTSIYYDSRTIVSYQNQRGTPANLERGDQVDVRVFDNGNGRYLADSITVTRSVSSNGYPNGNYPNGNSNGNPNGNPNNYPSATSGDIEGTVSMVDTRAQRIDVNVTSGNGLRSDSRTASVYYDGRTRVVYQNQSNYQPSDLERGDQVDIRLTSDRSGQVLADTITVLRSIRQ